MPFDYFLLFLEKDVEGKERRKHKKIRLPFKPFFETSIFLRAGVESTSTCQMPFTLSTVFLPISTLEFSLSS